MRKKVFSAVAVLLVAAAGLTAGCSTTEEQADTPAGNLQSRDVSTQSSDDVISIGTVQVQEPGSGLWDKPDGVTIGRVEPGEYPVYGAQDGWFQVKVAATEPQSQEGDNVASPAYAWVPGSSVSFSPASK